MLDKTEQKILDDIATIGWSIVAVEADEEGPSFAYSIGLLKTLDHPEIILLGLEPITMMHIINAIGHEIENGRRFNRPVLYNGIIKSFAVKIRPVARENHSEYLGYAQWHRRHVGQPGALFALQCLWPDSNGILPDEPHAADTIKKRQPLL